MTLAEAQAQLVIVQNAITALVSGKKLTELRIGDPTFYRHFTYSEITYENLIKHRNELYEIIDSFSTTVDITQYKRNTTVELICSKGRH